MLKVSRVFKVAISPYAFVHSFPAFSYDLSVAKSNGQGGPWSIWKALQLIQSRGGSLKPMGDVTNFIKQWQKWDREDQQDFCDEFELHVADVEGSFFEWTKRNTTPINLHSLGYKELVELASKLGEMTLEKFKYAVLPYNTGDAPPEKFMRALRSFIKDKKSEEGIQDPTPEPAAPVAEATAPAKAASRR